MPKTSAGSSKLAAGASVTNKVPASQLKRSDVQSMLYDGGLYGVYGQSDSKEFSMSKDRIFTVRRGYFYRSNAGGSVENLASTVKTALSNKGYKTKIVSSRDNFQTWPRESFFEVKFKIED